MKALSPHTLLLLHLLVYGLVLILIAPGVGLWALVMLGPLVWASWVDAQRFEIPDTASAFLAIGGVGWLLTLIPEARLFHLLGGVIWPALLWLVSRGYRILRGRTGLGFGDVKLMIGIGFWCGLTETIYVVLGAALSGIAALLLAALRPGAHSLGQSKLAFGPFLCLFAWCVWLAKAGI